mgnify:FL=1
MRQTGQNNGDEMRNRAWFLVRKLYTFCANALIVITLLLLFQDIWYRTFNDLLDRRYNERGNVLIFFLYAIIVIGIFQAWGGFKIGYNKVLNIVLSQMFSIVASNSFLYIIIALLVAKMHEMKNILKCILILTAEGMLLCFIITLLLSYIYTKLFKPWCLLQIDGEIQNYMSNKIKTREDKYTIGERISCHEPWSVLEEKIKQYDAVLLNELPKEMTDDIIKYCFFHAIRVYFTPRVEDIIVRETEAINLFDSPLFLNKNIGLSEFQMIVKRFFDIVVALAGVILTSPVMLITALCIKAHHDGPVFFQQERCTIHGRKFQIIKFRSMIVDAEKEGRSIPAEDDDERITAVGRVIRKYHIDELPQFFNVLKGDMSIVGPRPERIEHVEKYRSQIPEFDYRFKVKGGITGYAQVFGKYNTSAYDKLKMYIQYIVNYSLFLDIEIIVETLKVFFQKEKTEGFHHEENKKV